MDIIHDFILKSTKNIYFFTLDKNYFMRYSISMKRAGAHDICKEKEMPEDYDEWLDEVTKMTDADIEKMADYYARAIMGECENESN